MQFEKIRREKASIAPEKQPGSVGAIIHSAQIDPIHPAAQNGDKSAEAGAMNDGPYTVNACFPHLFVILHYRAKEERKAQWRQ